MENDYKRNYFWIKRDLKGNKHYYFKIKKASSDYPEEAFLFFFKFSSFFLGKKTTDASLSNR